MKRVITKKERFEIEELLKKHHLFYLKLFAHGYNKDQICDFMEISTGKMKVIKKEITNIFKTDDLNQIIIILLEKGVLNRLDYLDDNVKEEALIFSNRIFKKYFRYGDNFNSNKLLKNEIKGFFTNCEFIM